jgi:hypothetical protein
LPAVIVPLTAILLLTAPYEEIAYVQSMKNAVEARGQFWMWEGPEMSGTTTPSEIGAWALNAPAFELTNLVDPQSSIRVGEQLLEIGWLGGVAVFWCWIGWLVDTRRRTYPPSTVAYRNAWTVSFLILAAFCIAMAWVGTGGIHSVSGIELVVSHIGRRGLYDRALLQLSIIVWYVIGTVYFSHSAWKLWRAPRTGIAGRMMGLSPRLLIWGGVLGLLGFVIGLPPKWTLYDITYRNVTGAADGIILGTLLWWTFERVILSRRPETSRVR